jgi:glycosyltransferase involved in cell wall biosynthesis
MHRQRTVSLVIPAYNEESTIADVIEGFGQSPFLDEILVVDNNCTDRTAEIARSVGARVVQENKPGYGAALMAGMSAAKGDILVLTEADGSFAVGDLEKLLVYLDDAHMVLGTRTTKQMVEQGANMRFLLRWGNVFMAKWLELLWFSAHEPRLTDVGCTYRALTRDTFDRIRDDLREPGPAFSPEMMCAALRHDRRVIEVPVTYRRRSGGTSKHSTGLAKQIWTGLAMFRTICRKRLGRRISQQAQAATAPPPEAGC